MAGPTVVFDLDGTLIDTAPDLVTTLNTIFGHEGLPPIGYDAARKLIGGGARRMIERGLAAEGRNPAVERIDALVRDFLDHYAAHMTDRSRPFPGVEPALDELAQCGCRLAICTNKFEWLSVRLLEAFGLRKRFAAICGPDTVGVSKPDPQILRATVARAGGRIANAVMVGDSGIDIATARAASIPIVAVDFGYTETPVADLGPDRLVSSYAELPEAVLDLIAGVRQEFARIR